MQGSFASECALIVSCPTIFTYLLRVLMMIRILENSYLHSSNTVALPIRRDAVSDYGRQTTMSTFYVGKKTQTRLLSTFLITRFGKVWLRTIRNMHYLVLSNSMCCKPKGLPYVHDPSVGQGFLDPLRTVMGSLSGESTNHYTTRIKSPVGQGFSPAFFQHPNPNPLTIP